MPEYPRAFRPGTILKVLFDRESRRGSFDLVIEPAGPRIITDIND